MTTTLVLARHGETTWNAEGRWQGHADPPLNETGRAQATELAELLDGTGIERVFSSDLRRAHETALIVASRLDLPVVPDRELREIDVGSWSGLTRAEVAERFPDGYARWLDGEIGHDGETREQLTARIVGALTRLASTHHDERILVVTHGGSIRAARRHATGSAGEPIPNCGTVVLAAAGSVLFEPGTGR